MAQQTIILIAVFILLGFTFLFVWLFFRKSSRETEVTIQRHLETLSASFDQKYQVLQEAIHKQSQSHVQFLQGTHESSRRMFGEVERKLGSLQESTHHILKVGKDISSLKDLLKSPKLRGGLGEYLLSELLAQVLPQDVYQLQYRFKSGTQVDALIKLNDGKISVDSKFPIENYQRMLASEASDERERARKALVRDVKKHIDDICDKYILPDEGTYDFALMYIPSESVYYELFISDVSYEDGLSAYAMKKNLIPVSPGTFYNYLQTILHGLRGMRIEENAKIILNQINQLRVDYDMLDKEFQKLGTHLSNASNSYEKTSQKMLRIQDQVIRLSAQEESVTEDMA